jgi:Protein of unknown function (DUF664)
MNAAEIARTEPPRVGDERTMLDSWLDYYRATLLRKCAGLPAERLVERPCPPSTLSMMGLVRHMTEMERVFMHRLAEPDLPLHYCTEASPDGDFDDATPAGVESDLRTLTDHMVRSREIVAALSLDDTREGRREPYTVRFAYLYLIKEYARHLGHADLLRERLDGATGE